MSYSVKNSFSEHEIANNGSKSNAANCCSTASSELKLYQAFIFSVPILFTFVLLFLFYWFYLRRRRADWSSLRMRISNPIPISESSDEISRCEMGLKKELREMLPIIIFNESFSVKDTQGKRARSLKSTLGKQKQWRRGIIISLSLSLLIDFISRRRWLSIVILGSKLNLNGSRFLLLYMEGWSSFVHLHHRKP